MRSWRHAGLTAIALALTACQAVPQVAPAASVPSQARHRLQGTADFGERQTQIAAGELTSIATVTLLNASNQTVATARTDAAGAFSLLPGAAFAVAAGDVFYLDVYKGTRNNQVGGDVARLRTILQWTANGWTSTSGTTVVVNPLTTAVCVLQGLNSGTIAPTVTLGTVSGATVTSGNGTITANWSALNTLVRDLLAKDQDPLARISLTSGSYRAMPNKAQPLVLETFLTGTFADTQVDGTGALVLAPPRPIPNDPTSELETFAAANVAPNTVGAIATDGTYLYVKSWGEFGLNNSANHTLKKIGSGFNGTVRGANYGTLGSAPPSNGISLAYFDGYVYMALQNTNTQLYRVSTTTGASSVLDLPVRLNNYHGSTMTTGRPLITTDGRYLYTCSFGINNVVYSGYTIQVLDPTQGFQLVRQFTMDTSSYYTDGLYCDGTYLWLQEWNDTNVTPRMRRYRLSDGAREVEYTFPRFHDYTNGFQGYNALANNPLNGTWDPYNKVFWMGNLSNERIHLMRGGSYIPSGTWQSASLDTGSAAPLFGRLAWSGDVPEADGLSFQIRSATTLAGLGTATWYGPTGTSDAYTVSGAPLNPVHAKHRYVQVRATMSSQDQLTSPKLNKLSLEVLP